MVFADDTYAASTRRGICCARTVRLVGMAFSGKYVAAAAAGWELVRVAMVGTCSGGGRGSSVVSATFTDPAATLRGGVCACWVHADAPDAAPLDAPTRH